eukprot:3803159-Rhodomonas_salina.1
MAQHSVACVGGARGKGCDLRCRRCSRGSRQACRSRGPRRASRQPRPSGSRRTPRGCTAEGKQHVCLVSAFVFLLRVFTDRGHERLVQAQSAHSSGLHCPGRTA